MLIAPVLMYMAWQILYTVITELVLGSRLREDPDLIINLRYQSELS